MSAGASEPERLADGTLIATKDAPVGGQAVLEGVMMRGVWTWAVAVRAPSPEQVADGRTLGMKLQLLTTREPDLHQLAVAIAALEAVLAIEQPGEATEEERIGMEVVA